MTRSQILSSLSDQFGSPESVQRYLHTYYGHHIDPLVAYLKRMGLLDMLSERDAA